ncbi:MAG: NAD-dependent epimerase/dehydratase family protein [Devosia sp.]
MARGKVTVLGINGHIGHHVAKAFIEAGWEVTGFGRANRHPVSGVTFVKGDADSVADIRAATGDSEVVVNALNLPYHQWDKGRMETQTARVVEAMGTSGKTMLFPGNIYNYSHTNRLVTPELPQEPPTPRGEIRKRVEAQLRHAAEHEHIQVIILRAGDFFGPESSGGWFDQVILREAAKGKAAIPGKKGVGHSWAYLPDLGKAFEKLAWHRKELGAFETFHFAGTYVTPEQLSAAIVAAATVPLKVSSFPWVILSLLGFTNPILREIAKMGYLWQKPMELKDARLDAILGPDFGTPFAEAVAATVRPYFAKDARQAA